MDRGPAELELAVEAVWVLGGCRIPLPLLSSLYAMTPGSTLLLEGATVERMRNFTQARTGVNGSAEEFRVLGLTAGWETSIEVGERVAKARIRRELGG